MKKNILLCFIVVSLLICFVFAACETNTDTEREINIDVNIAYDEESGVLSWTCNMASGYTLVILRSDGSVLLSTDAPITQTFITLTNLKSDVYTATVTAFVGNNSASDSVVFATGGAEIPSPGITEDDEKIPQTYSKVVERLLPVYYYRDGDDSLVLPLTNDSGIKSVEAFGLILSDMYSYDEKENTLALDKSYFARFSVGYKAEVKWTYNDGDTDSTYVQICTNNPLKVEGLVDDTFIYDPTSADLKYLSRELVFFLNGEPVDLSIANLYKVCVDGKEISQIYYTPYSSSSKIKFTYSFFNKYVGVHLVEIYTKWGKTVLYTDIRTLAMTNDKYPYDIEVDYDSSYPEVYVTWKVNSDATNYTVRINGENYYSYNNPELFDGCKFNATGKIAYGDVVKVVAEYRGKGYESKDSAVMNIDLGSYVNEYLSYDESFYFMGKTHNFYISDEDEMRDLVYYMLIYYDSLPETEILKSGTTATYDNEVRIFVNPSYVATQSGLKTTLEDLALQLNEAIKGSFEVLGGERSNEYVILGDIDSTCVPDNEVRSSEMRKNISDVHYSTTGRSEDYEGFAINSVPEETVVYYSEELYVAVERGIRPVPQPGTSAYDIYERAKDVLIEIIDDSMSDYQKIHAISDWLAANVFYDYQLEEELSKIKPSDPEYDKFYSCRSLYLEGAMLDGVAVCNGYAKAMSLMCGIEGIPCYKIKGKSGTGQHAWNKVYAGGAWYVVDPTWAVKRYPDNSTTEVVRHQLLFMSESTSGNKNGGKHYEQYDGLYSGCYAGEDYNVYANTFFDFGGKLNDYVIESAEELRTLVDYYQTMYADIMITGRYIMIDMDCTITNLTRYASVISSSSDSYIYSVESYDGSHATLKMTKK